MRPLSHYLRIHLAGASAGIDLFARAAAGHLDPEARATLASLHGQLREEKQQLQRMAERLGVRESVAMSAGARVGERLGRLKPNGSWRRRTELTDLVELEAMRTAVAGKRAGWHALRAIADQHDALDAAELDELLAQADHQLETIADAHTHAARRALGR